MMLADGTPHGERSWLARPLAGLTAWVLRAPKAVIALAVLLAAVSVAVSFEGLGFRTSRLDLLNPESTYNRRWLAFLEEFGDQDDILVVVEGTGSHEVTPVLDHLAAEVRDVPGHFDAVLHKRELAQLRRKGLHFLDTMQLRQIDQLLEQLEAALRGQWSELSAAAIIDHAASPREDEGLGMSPPAATGQSMAPFSSAWFDRYLESLSAALAEDPHYRSPWSWLAEPLGQLQQELESQYLLADQDRFGFLVLRIVRDEEGFEQSRGAVAKLRRIVDAARIQYPGVGIGLTGMPILEHDEMQSSQSDTVSASLLSLCGVACVFVAGFGGLRRPLLAVAVLLISIAWSFGYITFAVGHLNILSTSFGVILIGLGIDFGVHYIAQYGQNAEVISDRRAAMLETAQNVGPGIVIGGVTTALAFCTAVLTDFTGVAELGLIAAGGIVLCIVGAIVVLPALLTLCDRSSGALGPSLPVASLVAPFSRFPRLVLLIATAATLVASLGISRLEFDHNLLHLQPAHLESVELERKLSSRVNRGIWYAVSVSGSREELLEKKERFGALPEVASTEEIVSLLPQSSRQRSRMISRIRSRLEQLPASPPLVPMGGQERMLHALRRVAGAGGEAAVRGLYDRIARMSGTDYFRQLSRFQQQMAEELLATLATVRAMSQPAPPSADDLPPGLTARFVGRNGQHLLRVYGRGDIWDTQGLQRFVEAVEKVDPFITGHPVQTYYASRQMQRSYVHAAIYSLLAISIVLVIDFRRIRYWLSALFPLGLGMLQLFGLLGWLNIPLNPANLIVLPLILGIGIDDGVHVVHDFLRHSRRPYRLSNSTATAILITSATTMIGFGSMMLANHRGLRSLGQVLTLGIFCCLISSLAVLPPLLIWLNHGFSGNEDRDRLQDST